MLQHFVGVPRVSDLGTEVEIRINCYRLRSRKWRYELQRDSTNHDPIEAKRPIGAGDARLLAELAVDVRLAAQSLRRADRNDIDVADRDHSRRRRCGDLDTIVEYAGPGFAAGVGSRWRELLRRIDQRL